MTGSVLVCGTGICYSQDSHRPFHTQHSAIHQGVLLAEIRDATPYTLCRKSLTEFCESKLLNACRIYRSDPRSLSLVLERLVPDARDANRLPRLPIGLLPVIGGSIATIIAFAESRARYTPRTDGQQPGLSGFQTSLSTLRALLAGLAATILLSLLELSIRLACY